MTKAEMLTKLQAMEDDLEQMRLIVAQREGSARANDDISNRVYQMARVIGILEVARVNIQHARIGVQVRYDENPEQDTTAEPA